MKQSDFLHAFASLSPIDQGDLLLALAHDLTVAFREFYVADKEEHTASSKVVIGFNELHHQLSAQAAKLFRDDKNRCPDDVFVGILYERAHHSGIVPGFEWAIGLAMSRDKGPRTKD